MSVLRGEDSPTLATALRTPEEVLVSVVTVAGKQLPIWIANVVHSWHVLVLRECIQGRSPDLGAFPDLALTSQTPPENLRRRMHDYVLDRIKCGIGGSGLLPTVLPMGSRTATALQWISDDKAPHLRVNQAIRGNLWVMPQPGWLDVGWELPTDEWEDASHITVLNGHIQNKPAALVLWNTDPTILRSATGERLLEMQARSIGVAQARERWRRLLELPEVQVTDLNTELPTKEGITAAIWLAVEQVLREGIHPDTRGARIVDIVEADMESGLPSRRSGIGPPLLETSLTSPDKENNEPLDAHGHPIGAGQLQDAFDQVEIDDLLERTLTEDQAKAFRMNQAGYRQADIAAELGVSQPRVSQLLKEAIERLTAHHQP